MDSAPLFPELTTSKCKYRLPTGRSEKRLPLANPAVLEEPPCTLQSCGVPASLRFLSFQTTYAMEHSPKRTRARIDGALAPTSLLGWLSGHVQKGWTKIEETIPNRSQKTRYLSRRKARRAHERDREHKRSRAFCPSVRWRPFRRLRYWPGRYHQHWSAPRA